MNDKEMIEALEKTIKRDKSLRGIIRHKYGSQYEFAQRLGITPMSLSHKLCERTNWQGYEIIRASRLLGFETLDEIERYFGGRVEELEDSPLNKK